jgi:molybdate transport system regulatory protein
MAGTRRIDRAAAPRRLRRPRAPLLRPRLRVLRGREVALGPGKVALLEAIGATGTIAAAARALRMSYMRAWTLVGTMNRSFRSPLVRTERGGAGRGTTRLTATGRLVVRLYREMERLGLAAAAAPWARLRRRLKP